MSTHSRRAAPPKFTAARTTRSPGAPLARAERQNASTESRSIPVRRDCSIRLFLGARRPIADSPFAYPAVVGSSSTEIAATDHAHEFHVTAAVVERL